LRPKVFYIIFKNSVRTTKKTLHFTITKINWLTLFKEIIAVYSENLTKHTNILCVKNAELLTVKAGGTYSYQRALRGCATGINDSEALNSTLWLCGFVGKPTTDVTTRYLIH
jgi:hypothetical protein